MKILSYFFFLMFLLMSFIQMGGAESNLEHGAKIFKRCAACHFVEANKNKIGPSLYAIVGRRAAMAANYNYSVAMKGAGAAGLVWTEENLRNYLHDPHNMIKGTKMAPVKINNPKEFADLLLYLNAAGK